MSEDQPTGTVTFLFTDVEGSTRLWEADEAGMQQAIARHDEIMREIVASKAGYVFTTAGDSFAATFHTAADAAAAAIDARSAISDEEFQHGIELAVRIGIHTGTADERDGDYFGRDVNLAARVMDAGHGGQILLSGLAAGLLSDHDFVDHGEHALRDLESSVHIFELSAPQGEPGRSLRTLDVLKTNLPLQRSSFIGRQESTAQVRAEILAKRMVTLTGVGGVGKTRLAVHSAALTLPEFPDGCWFVELAAIHDLRGVVEILAGALSIPPLPGLDPFDACVSSLRAKRALLVIDNCEHVLDESAELCEAILDGAAGVHILATSREGLGIEGEQILAVRSLPVGDDAEVVSEAMELFIERARFHTPDFSPSGSELTSVRAICARLDGVPLAIELAAARIPTLSPTELLDHLEDRFALLTGGRRRARGRHQALRSTIDWSYGLLSDDQKTGFRRLTAFASTFNLDEAAAATGISSLPLALDLLDDLMSKSLLEAEHIEHETRYRFLETIRQYGEQLLEEDGEMESVMLDIAGYYTAWAHTAVYGMLGAEESTWIRGVEREVPNLRRVVDWAIDNDDAGTALRLLAPFHRCLTGGAYLLDQVAWSAWGAFSETDVAAASEAFSLAALLPSVQDDLERIEAIFDRVSEIADKNGHDVPASLMNLVAQVRGGRDPATGHETSIEALAIARAAGDEVWQVMNMTSVVVWGMPAGIVAPDEAAEMTAVALKLARLHGPSTQATATFGYAYARIQSDPEGAYRHFCEAIELSAAGTAVSDAGLFFAPRMALELGRPGEAAELLASVIDEWITFGRSVYLDGATALAAWVAAEAGDNDDGWALLEAEHGPRIAVLIPDYVSHIRSALDERPAVVETLTFYQAVDLAKAVFDRNASFL